MKIIKKINEKIDKLDEKLNEYYFFRALGKGIDYIGRVLLLTCIVCIIGFPTYFYLNTKNVEDIVFNQVVELRELKVDKENSKGIIKYVDGFDIEKDTFTFANFTTLENPGGNCFGYNAYELLRFEGRLDDVLGDNLKSSDYTGELQDLEIIKSDTDYVYSFRKDKNYNNDYNSVSKIAKKINSKEMVRNSYKIVKAYAKAIYTIIFKSKEDIANLETFDFNNKDFGNILKDMNSLHLTQSEEDKVYYVSDSFNSASWTKNLEDTVNEKALPNIDYIIDSIDNNKLIILGIKNLIDGHAVLGYAYEKIDDNNIKVYVNDSNFPLIKKEVLTNEDREFNQAIKENCYVLFTKELSKDSWSYIYEPNLMGNYVYGAYNSFIPGTKLKIYKI